MAGSHRLVSRLGLALLLIFGTAMANEVAPPTVAGATPTGAPPGAPPTGEPPPVAGGEGPPTIASIVSPTGAPPTAQATMAPPTSLATTDVVAPTPIPPTKAPPTPLPPTKSPPTAVPSTKSPPTPASTICPATEPGMSDSCIGFEDGLSCEDGENCCCEECYSANICDCLDGVGCFLTDVCIVPCPTDASTPLPPTKAPPTPVPPTEAPLTMKPTLLPTVKPMSPPIEAPTPVPPTQAPRTPETRSFADILPYEKDLSILYNLLNGAGLFQLLMVSVH